MGHLRLPALALLIAVAPLSACESGFINWSGQQNADTDPGDLTSPGQPLHCVDLSEMTNADIDALLRSQGYTVRWRVDGPDVDGPPNEAVLTTALPGGENEAVMVTRIPNDELADRAGAPHPDLVDRAQLSCP